MKRHLKASAAAVSAAALVLTAALAGCGQDATASAGLGDCTTDPVGCNAGERIDGGEVTWAVDGSWVGWNTVKTSDNNAYVTQALVGMWPTAGQFGPDGKWVVNDGLFAADPEIVSENPVQVKYTLQDGANWGDGTDISIDDFIYHWYANSGDQDLCDGCTPASDSWGSQVESIEGSGDDVTITYKDSYHSAEWQYEEVLSAPAHVAEDADFDWEYDAAAMKDSQDYFSETVPTWTTGPYRITKAVAGDYVMYEPNPDWAGSAEVTLDKVTFRVMEGLDSIVTALRNGEIDGASPATVDVETITQLEGADDVSYAIAGGNGWEHIDLNVENEFLSDPVLRTAVLTAIDVENIIERTHAYVQSDIERKLNPLFRNDSEYFQDFLTVTGQGTGDIELSVGLLTDAGYEWDENTRLITPEGERVELDYRYTQSKESRVTTAELVQANLSGLGIKVNLVPIPDADLGTVLGEHDFDMVNFGWSQTPTFVNSVNQYWSSDSGSNFGRLDDEELDGMIDQVSGTLDFDEAAELANVAVKQVVADAYTLPLVDTPVAVMVSDRLVNVRDNWASQQRAGYNIAEWGVSE
ncbi:ABC transporter family substrate-binding protein [Glycomyces buryatensis]|uniref:ABC transporter family substrate-binding protein n=1 Tax=Glycomyces buryatensis TaxID=2570927 RepID=A0A4S8QGH0_9ACTN|nr:ABC transporter family substrate-binding protein [Glycomyces buryatensis]THV42272.1 ABC transporter family substrate-binding protein [Glycomyces buryatensis]